MKKVQSKDVEKIFVTPEQLNEEGCGGLFRNEA
jgi:hypothetical protein